MKECLYSNNELIGFMQEFSRENNNSTPTSRGMDDDKKYPHSSTFMRRFRGWNNAVKKAGFKPNIERPSKKKYSDQKLLQNIKNRAKELKRAPPVKKMNIPNGPSPQTYIERFGSWRQALEKVGLSPQRGYIDDELFELMEKLEDGLGRNLKYEDILNAEGYPSPMTYVNHFETWNNAKHAFQEWRNKKVKRVAKNLVNLCKEHKLNYLMLRDLTMTLIDTKRLDISMIRDGEKAMEYMKFIKDNFHAICERMKITEPPKKIELEHEEERDIYGNVIMVVDILKVK